MTNNTRYFTVGPAAIYPGVCQWTQEFFDLGLGSIYHRSPDFQIMYKKLDHELRQLMSIPDSHAIFIASSGSEIMERILQNCVRNSSFHFVNGAFSKKFYEYALRLGIYANKLEVPFGEGFSSLPNISAETELICITHNETSTGIKTSEEFIHQVKMRYPNILLAVDTVSSAPLFCLDFSLVDICFFSSQKAFGLPAGLGIFIINKNLAELLAAQKINLGKGAHNTLSDYLSNYDSFQTPSTPNVLGVYLMAKVAKEMNSIGRKFLLEETTRKKDILHRIFNNNPFLKLLNSTAFSSDTIIVTEFLIEKSKVLQHLEQHQIKPSSGYGSHKETQLRFANFPANTMEDIVYLEKVLVD